MMFYILRKPSMMEDEGRPEYIGSASSYDEALALVDKAAAASQSWWTRASYDIAEVLPSHHVAAADNKDRLVGRTFFLPPSDAEKLRVRAFRTGLYQNDIIVAALRAALEEVPQ